jgi:hypothetical protein
MALTPQRFRKRPVEVEAIQATGEAWERAVSWCGAERVENGLWAIRTLEGFMVIGLNDWIIRGVKGEFYPCKPDIFDATYEAVN